MNRQFQNLVLRLLLAILKNINKDSKINNATIYYKNLFYEVNEFLEKYKT